MSTGIIIAFSLGIMAGGTLGFLICGLMAANHYNGQDDIENKMASNIEK